MSIQTIRPQHDKILEYLLAAPTMPRGELALLVGMTESHLSTVINSDIFQAKLKVLQEKKYEELLPQINLKTAEVADKVLDKISAQVDEMQPETSIKAGGLLLDRVLKDKPVTNQNNTQFNITFQQLQEAEKERGGNGSLDIRGGPLPAPREEEPHESSVAGDTV